MGSPLPFTLAVIVIALTILVIYDVYRYKRYGIPGTISHRLYVDGTVHPFLAFIIGFVVGGLVIGLGVHFWL